MKNFHSVVFFLIFLFPTTTGFLLINHNNKVRNSNYNNNLQKTSWSKSKSKEVLLHMAGNNQFDISKPVFDLFALRSVRGDALLRYNNLNQSEPLRINLYGLLALTCFSFPLISESIGGEAQGIVGTVGSIFAGLGGVALFVNECKKRIKQLNRFEKELDCLDLKLRLPMNVLSDMAFTDAASLQTLQKTSSPPRILVVCAPGDKMKDSLQKLNILGRRLKQSSTFVVPIPTDGSTREDWNIPARLPWLAEAKDLGSWLQYFDGLSEGKSSEALSSFRWFGLNTNGRSFGSGIGDAPEWLELMGQYLRPTVSLAENDRNFRGAIDDEGDEVLKVQAKFYENLIQGNLQGMQEVFGDSTESTQVTNVITNGGRIDKWESCLEEEARPAGMKISGCDAILISKDEAYTTCVEFPTNAIPEGMTATLLAVQQWKKNSDTNNWQLVLHQTIPWTSETRAQGTLRCDCRGCVALTQDANERRTFGGLIG